MESASLKLLGRIEGIIDAGLGVGEVNRVLEMLGGNPVDTGILESLMLYNESLPKAEEYPLSTQTRFLHFLWDAFDKLPLCLAVSFSIPFRRMLAERLFGACGKGLIAEENVRFNFAALIATGDSVFFNRNVFMDSKGGIEIGDFVGIAEDVRIFSHGHSEAAHLERTYSKVTLGPYSKIYSGATILPGVTVGEEAIVASGSMVTKDVPPGMVAAGVPAKVIRERSSQGRRGDDLGHIWLF